MLNLDRGLRGIRQKKKVRHTHEDKLFEGEDRILDPFEVSFRVIQPYEQVLSAYVFAPYVAAYVSLEVPRLGFLCWSHGNWLFPNS